MTKDEIQEKAQMEAFMEATRKTELERLVKDVAIKTNILANCLADIIALMRKLGMEENDIAAVIALKDLVAEASETYTKLEGTI